jgi:hypothetical protein
MVSGPFIARTIVLGTVAGLMGAVPAAAQTAARPFTGLFGGTTRTATEKQVLDVSLSVAEAYDENLVADATPTAASSALQTSGTYTSMVPQLNFAQQGQRLQFAMNAGSNLRYYTHGHQLISLSHSIGAGITARLTPKSTFSVNQSVSYSPASLFGLFAPAVAPALGDIVAPSDDVHVNNSERSYVYSTTAGFSRNVASATTLSLMSGYSYSDFVGQAPGFTDLRAYDVGGRLNHSIDRRVGFRLGYKFRKAEYSSVQQPVEHTVDIGFDYTRPLSATRKLAVGFTLGPTLIDGPIEGLISDSSFSRQYRVVGEAFVSRDIGRTWNGRASYRRGVGFVQGLPQPVFSDAFTLQTTGLLSRRTDLDLTAALSSGGAALTGASTPFAMYNADARLRFALNRTLAAYVEYLFYYYDFNQGLQLPPGVPSRLTRNGARIGLTLWVPVRHR